MNASEIIAALQWRGWKRIAVSGSVVFARVDGVRIMLRFDGAMMFDPIDGEHHVMGTSIVLLIDGVERGRIERWPLLPEEELSTLEEAARLVEVVVRTGDDVAVEMDR
jgi:hypothetical protein